MGFDGQGERRRNKKSVMGCLGSRGKAWETFLDHHRKRFDLIRTPNFSKMVIARNLKNVPQNPPFSKIFAFALGFCMGRKATVLGFPQTYW
jgi:hypothetical protein